MVKVFIIIGLFLVIAGVPGLFWCSFENERQNQQIAVCKAKYKHQVDEYFQKLTGSSLEAADANAIAIAMAAPNPEKMKPNERLQYQQERLLADIDELAEANLPIPINADIVYGDDWRQKVTEYKNKKQSRTAVQMASATGLAAGAVMFVAAIVFGFFSIIVKAAGWLVKGKNQTDVLKKTLPQQPSRPAGQECISAPAASFASSPPPAAKSSSSSSPSAEEFRKQLTTQTENLRDAVENLKNLTSDLQKQASGRDGDISKQLEKGLKIQHAFFKHENEQLKKTQKLAQSSHENIVQLFSEGLNAVRMQIEDMNKAIEASVLRQPEPVDISAQLEKSLELQAQVIKREIEPLKEKSSVAIVGESVSKNLADLTEQICAIRDYAAKQQQRLAKLQDGYDWNIIKNFCLRLIRCVDNLDDRIGEILSSGGSAEHLASVREELLFILESNGIEQFGAKIKSDYRGQETRLQVLNEREDTEDTALFGRIAQIVRPGYQCRVSDEYTKIVRPAQVRLYGQPCLSEAAVRGS